MTVFVIPNEDAETLGNFFFDVELDRIQYQMNFQYNDRDGFWYFDILDLDGNEIRTGVKAVVNWPVLAYGSSPLRPPGQLMFLGIQEPVQEPTLENFGTDVVLVYADEDTIAAL